MKRTILVLTLTLLLSSAASAMQASGDPADLNQPSPSRSISSGHQSNEASPNVKPYIEDLSGVSMSAAAISLVALLY